MDPAADQLLEALQTVVQLFEAAVLCDLFLQRFDPPAELPDPNIYTITAEEKAIINVGSVGQPRDRDPRASYTVVYERGESPENYQAPEVGEGEYCTTIKFVRLEYDTERAAQKVFDTPELDDFLGSRLFDGR